MDMILLYRRVIARENNRVRRKSTRREADAMISIPTTYPRQWSRSVAKYKTQQKEGNRTHGTWYILVHTAINCDVAKNICLLSWGPSSCQEFNGWPQKCYRCVPIPYRGTPLYCKVDSGWVGPRLQWLGWNRQWGLLVGLKSETATAARLADWFI